MVLYDSEGVGFVVAGCPLIRAVWQPITGSVRLLGRISLSAETAGRHSLVPLVPPSFSSLCSPAVLALLCQINIFGVCLDMCWIGGIQLKQRIGNIRCIVILVNIVMVT